MEHSIIEVLRSLFKRDLEKLRHEIVSYTDEKNLWIVEQAISNSAGNLCLHLVGNTNAFICAELGKTGYIRDRKFEFSGKDIPRAKLLEQIDATLVDVDQVLANLTTEKLKENYPVQVFGSPMTIEYFLVHLATHLGYHLGQVNYHRRLLDK